MLSYHGQRAGGRTRFAIAVNHPSRPAPAATSLARRPSFDRDSPDPVSGPLSRDANISDPNLDILLPPLPAPTSVIDCSPLTPPSSSQVTSSSISPPGVHQPSPVVEPPRFPNLLAPPSTWEALNHRIEAFALSRITAPCITPMNDDLWASFVDNLETCDRSSALCRLRYTFESESKSLIMYCMPVPEHDAIQGLFEHSISEMVREHSLLSAERSLFAVKVGTDVNAFEGSKQGSRKRADLSISPQKALDDDEEEEDEEDNGAINGDFPSIAVEVGFTEDYVCLVKDMELWLTGSSGKVRVVVLVNLTETPTFNGGPFLRSATPSPPEQSGAHPPSRKWQNQGPYGPIIYDGHVLVGEICGFVELWRLDPVSSLPKITSKRIVLPPQPGDDDCFTLSLADVFGGAERVPDRLDPEEQVRFEFDIYRRLLSRSMKEHGRQRLAAAVAAVRKREAGGDDAEWTRDVQPKGGKRHRA